MTECNFALLLVPLSYQSPQYEVAGKIMYKTLRSCRVWLYAGFSANALFYLHKNNHISFIIKIVFTFNLYANRGSVKSKILRRQKNRYGTESLLNT